MIAIAAMCIASFALEQAVGWYGTPFAGVLITSDGNMSSIGMPTWSGIEQGLRFPDHFLSIDGVPVTPSRGEYAARSWDRAVEDAARLGRTAVHAHVATATGEREVDLRIERLDAISWWIYGGSLIFVGLLYALFGVIALSTSPKGQLSRTFAWFAIPAALFFITVFDMHTTRTMVPIFHAAYAWIPFALTTLALRLPDDVSFVRRHTWALPLFRTCGFLLAAVVVIRDIVGAEVTRLQTVCSMLLGCALFLFVAVLAVRYLRSAGTRRATLGIMLRATGTPYLIVGFAFFIGLLSSRASVAAFLVIPALALAPLATGVAFARYDLWGSRAVLSRVLTRSLAGGVACIVAVGIGTVFAVSLGIPFRGALVAAALGAIVSASLVNIASRSVDRRFFPAVTEYKPTIAQLSEELTSITDPNEVAVAVEHTVRRWLPCEDVHFVAYADTKVDEHDVVEVVDPNERRIPATFGGRTLGLLTVGRKRGGALFTTDDVDLLGTIANQAGLALAHAHSYAELERRRRQQAAAWQTERLALVETVAAEIAHEIRYPINFFRSVFRRDPTHAVLDAEEIDIGCEEVDRLERLVSGLRRMVGHRIERRVLPVADLTARAEMLLRDALGGRKLEVDVPADAALRCDADQVTQVLVNLVANAIDASGPRGRIGLGWTADEDDAELVVWDDGPGFEGDPSRLFSAWYTTKPRGTGLGLAITQRIVRAHGWVIDVVRADGLTRFVLTIPLSDVIGGERDGVEHASEGARMAARGDEEHEDTDRR